MSSAGGGPSAPPGGFDRLPRPASRERRPLPPKYEGNLVLTNRAGIRLVDISARSCAASAIGQSPPLSARSPTAYHEDFWDCVTSGGREKLGDHAAAVVLQRSRSGRCMRTDTPDPAATQRMPR